MNLSYLGSSVFLSKVSVNSPIPVFVPGDFGSTCCKLPNVRLFKKMTSQKTHSVLPVPPDIVMKGSSCDENDNRCLFSMV